MMKKKRLLILRSHVGPTKKQRQKLKLSLRPRKMISKSAVYSIPTSPIAFHMETENLNHDL